MGGFYFSHKPAKFSTESFAEFFSLYIIADMPAITRQIDILSCLC